MPKRRLRGGPGRGKIGKIGKTKALSLTAHAAAAAAAQASVGGTPASGSYGGDGVNGTTGKGLALAPRKRKAVELGHTSTHPMKTFHSPRKEEEQRRQLEAEFVEAFKRRHSLRLKLGDVEKQILDLEKGYLREFSTSVGNAIQGYNFDFLADKSPDNADTDKATLPSVEDLLKSEGCLIFSKSSTTSTVNELVQVLPPKCSPNKK